MCASNDRHRISHGAARRVREDVTQLLAAPDSGSPPVGPFDIVFSSYQGEIHRFVRRTIGDGLDVDDLTQETFVRALRAFHLFDGRYPRAWLYRIAANVCTDHLRRAGRDRMLREVDWIEIAAPEDAEADSPYSQDQVGRLSALLKTLPPRQQKALSLRVLEDLPYEQVARRMGGTSQAARANVYQALRRLRAASARRQAPGETAP